MGRTPSRHHMSAAGAVVDHSVPPTSALERKPLCTSFHFLVFVQQTWPASARQPSSPQRLPAENAPSWPPATIIVGYQSASNGPVEHGARVGC